MKKFFLFTLLAALFAGCAHKDIKIFAEDKPYVEALRYTKRGVIAISLENKAQIIATYLNPLEHKNDKEYFFVRVYIDNDFQEANKAGLYHPGFTLTLNGKKPAQIKELSQDSLLAKRMPLVESWYRLYLVAFPKSEAKKLSLVFSHKEYGAARLAFEVYQEDS